MRVLITHDSASFRAVARPSRVPEESRTRVVGVADVEERPAPNRGPWIVAGAIVLAAIIVVGALVLLKDDPCGAWQKDVRDVVERGQEFFAEPTPAPYAPDATAYRSEGQALGEELQRVRDRRPSGCEYPED